MRLITALLFVLPIVCNAGGKLSLKNNIIHIKKVGRDFALEVSNSGDEMLYLEIIQERVINPGKQPELRARVEALSDPDIFLPLSKISLAPGQIKKIPIQVISSPHEKQVWRVTFVNRGALMSASERELSYLNINFNYGAVIYHYPNAHDGDEAALQGR
ncbi:hypothetical protein [Erwinia sp. HR93]|uniref:hypothetical protein n=1 Tax=Erwinia sp. HR93 TaxID=3094840 RepID=UPI002ADEC461|nr:hypothetical protein [Erwinia sp. HR93]MEA1063267.1 hypothetical protein [Erwinia sp. HR93]